VALILAAVLIGQAMRIAQAETVTVGEHATTIHAPEGFDCDGYNVQDNIYTVICSPYMDW